MFPSLASWYTRDTRRLNPAMTSAVRWENRVIKPQTAIREKKLELSVCKMLLSKTYRMQYRLKITHYRLVIPQTSAVDLLTAGVIVN